MVVPWVLGNVISGSPMLFEPYIESAKYAARYRNYHWEHVKQGKRSQAIVMPPRASPYPSKSDQISDRPVDDKGGNFGRLARTGMMDDYMRKLDSVPICGIKTMFWREFLKAFQESSTDQEAQAALMRLREKIHGDSALVSTKAQAALAIIAELERLLE